MQFGPFITFLKGIKDISSNFDTRVMLITLTKQIILIKYFYFNEKSLTCFKKFNKKDQIVSIFYKL